MPYIKPERRQRLDNAIDNLVAFLNEVKDEERDGEVNYIITKILCSKYCFPEKYYRYERAIGILECAKLEFYRRHIAPYENEKLMENGDVE